jgi:hypothetical protein
VIARAPGGGFRARRRLGSRPFTADERRRAHARLAATLPSEAPSRVFHATAAGDHRGAAEAALASARAAYDRVDVPLAVALTDEGLRAVRQSEASPEVVALEAGLLAIAVLIAFRERTATAYDRVRYELARARVARTHAERLQRLTRAMQQASAGHWREALADVEDLGELGEPDLDRCRMSVFATISQLCPADTRDRLLDVQRAWARTSPLLGARGWLLAWEGLVAWQAGDFAGAASLQESAHAAHRDPVARLIAAANAAWSHVYAGDVDRARALASTCLPEAVGASLPFVAARLEWTIRRSDYIKGAWSPPDEALLAAARALHAPSMLGELLLVEAGMAWRLDMRETTARLALEAERVYRDAGLPHAADLARALAAAVGVPIEPEWVAACVGRATTCPHQTLAAQILGFLALATAEPIVVAAFDATEARLGPETRARCMDLASPAELRARRNCILNP